jgi:hypothetical protein
MIFGNLHFKFLAASSGSNFDYDAPLSDDVDRFHYNRKRLIVK